MGIENSSKAKFIKDRFLAISDNILASIFLYVIVAAIPTILGIIYNQMQLVMMVILVITQPVIIGLLVSMRRKYSQGFIHYRGEFPPTENVIDDAKNMIWVGGIVLDTMAQRSKKFRNKMKTNPNFKARFLAIDPNNDALLEETSHHLGESKEGMRGRLRASLETFSSLAHEYPHQVDIRVVNRRPALGYFIIDPYDNRGYMTAETYLANSEKHQRPIIRLSKKVENKWFQIYSQDFERIWNDAKPWLQKTRLHDFESHSSAN
jgi:hypothetical protein